METNRRTKVGVIIPLGHDAAHQEAGEDIGVPALMVLELREGRRELAAKGRELAIKDRMSPRVNHKPLLED